jgi:tetratricopeptide (TPR) repeat protein
MRSRRFHPLFLLVTTIFALSAAVFAQSSKFRTVTVNSEPNATVWVDGVKYGQTDESGEIEFGLPKTGSHLLRVRADGFAEVSRTFTAALSSLKVPLKTTTDKAELKYQEAERLSQLDRDKAIAAYREALKLKPAYINAHIGLIRVLSEARYYDQTITAIGVLKKLKPGIAEVSAIEGRVFKEVGEEEKAVASFKRAIIEGKGYQPEAYAGLGLLYKERSETAAGEGDTTAEDEADAKAIEYLAKAAEQLYTSPDAPIIYQLLGLVYEKQHRFDEAIKLYQDFLEIFPESPEAEAVRSFIVQFRKQQAREQ